MGDITRRADILVVAIGRPNAITADMVQPGAIVIDVGINRIEDSSRKRGYRLVGDVDFLGGVEIAVAGDQQQVTGNRRRTGRSVMMVVGQGG